MKYYFMKSKETHSKYFQAKKAKFMSLIFHINLNSKKSKINEEKYRFWVYLRNFIDMLEIDVFL